MAGIYVHIPFCKSRCYYCDFYSCTALGMKKEMVQAICMELEQRKDYLSGETIETIYFGGGTPSLLTIDEVDKLLSDITKHFTLVSDIEITLEANPDDLNLEYLKQLKKLGINRLSIGTQSFDDTELKFLNRRHSAIQAIKSIEDSQKAGFDNISIDLIYAIPESPVEKWQKSLEQALQLSIQHLSAYLLTLEIKSVLSQIIRANNIEEIADDECYKQFEMLTEAAERSGFIHYEISNFGREGYFSKHNTSYWKNIKYLGVGPSAHSYDLQSRQWNYSDNKEYMKKVKKGDKYYSTEILDIPEKYNDYILTGLRTMWGVDREYIKKNFGEEIEQQFMEEVKKNEDEGYIEKFRQNYRIAKKAKFITDAIVEGFMIIDHDH
ncbi:MAG: radical SAM family heme chaperone HemW [Bacteroidales bacterium]|nr:radical SAM family heme chaperone HemW [Bacteroidales bacterium]